MVQSPQIHPGFRLLKSICYCFNVQRKKLHKHGSAKTTTDRSTFYQIFRKYLRSLCLTKYRLFLVKYFLFIADLEKRFSPQHCLAAMLKKWRFCNDKSNSFGALLKDLSKAFHCLSHDELIAKIRTYNYPLSKACWSYHIGLKLGRCQLTSEILSEI